MRSCSNKNTKNDLLWFSRRHFTLLFYRGRQRNVLRITTCTAVVLLIKSFVWWRSRCHRVLHKLPIDVMKSKEHIKRHMTGPLKQKAKTNIKLFVHLLPEWTKTNLSFFLGNKHRHSHKNLSTWDASPRAIILFERDNVLTYLCAQVLMCWCTGVLVCSWARVHVPLSSRPRVLMRSCALLLEWRLTRLTLTFIFYLLSSDNLDQTQ